MATKRYGAKKTLGMVPVFTASDELIQKNDYKGALDPVFQLGPELKKYSDEKDGKVAWAWRAAKKSAALFTLGGVGLSLILLGVRLPTEVYDHYRFIPNVTENYENDIFMAKNFLTIRQALYQDVLGKDDPWFSNRNFTEKVIADKEFIESLIDQMSTMDEKANEVILYVDTDAQKKLRSDIKYYKDRQEELKAIIEYKNLNAKYEELTKDMTEGESTIIGKFSNILQATRRMITGELTLEDVKEKINNFDKARFGEENENGTLTSKISDLEIMNDIFNEKKTTEEKIIKHNEQTKEYQESFYDNKVKAAYIDKLKVRVYSQILDGKNIGVLVNGEAYKKDAKLVVDNIVPGVFKHCMNEPNKEAIKRGMRSCSTLSDVIDIIREYFDTKFIPIHNFNTADNDEVTQEMIISQDHAIDLRNIIRGIEENVKVGKNYTKNTFMFFNNEMNELGLNMTNILDNARVAIRTFQEMIPDIFPNTTQSVSAFFNQFNAEMDSTLFTWTVYLAKTKRTNFGFLKIAVPPMIVSSLLMYGGVYSEYKVYRQLTKEVEYPDMDTPVPVYTRDIEQEERFVALRNVVNMFFNFNEINMDDRNAKLIGFFSIIVYRFMCNYHNKAYGPWEKRRKAYKTLGDYKTSDYPLYHKTKLIVLADEKDGVIKNLTFRDKEYAFFWRNMIFEMLKLNMEEDVTIMVEKTMNLINYTAIRVFDRAFITPLYDECVFGLETLNSEPNNNKNVTYYSRKSNPLFEKPEYNNNNKITSTLRDFKPHISSFVLLRIMHNDVRFKSLFFDESEEVIDRFVKKDKGTLINSIVEDSIEYDEAHIGHRIAGIKVKIDGKEVELLNEKELQNAENFLTDSTKNGEEYDLMNTKYKDAARHFMTMLIFGSMCSKRYYKIENVGDQI